MKWKQISGTWKKIFTNWKYLSSAIIIAVLFYLVNVLISSWSSLVGFYPSFGFLGTLKFLFILLIGFKETVRFHSFVSLVIISILLGMLFSLVGYKVNLGKGNGGKKIGFFGGIGLFLATLAPGCAACGIGLASALGVGTAFLTFLPYEGLELSIASIGILGFTILKITEDMHTCKTPKFKLLKKLKGGND